MDRRRHCGGRYPSHRPVAAFRPLFGFRYVSQLFRRGSAAQVALYTPHWHHFAIIRRILLRMRSWQNYIFLEGH
jgi:hypothetical protein